MMPESFNAQEAAAFCESDAVGQAADWCSHLALLYLSLCLTKGPVLELGSGEYSTKKLRLYCLDHNRQFNTYDGNWEWAQKTGSEYVADWDWHDLWTKHYGIAFVDHAPAPIRWRSIKLLFDKADVIVVHDSQGDPEYLLDRVFYLFVHRLDDKSSIPWTSALSNSVDLNAFNGERVCGREMSYSSHP